MGYAINKSYALSGSQGDSRVASKNYIIIHDTGNDNNKGSNSAGNEASYMKGHWQAAYTHFIVDDKNIFQVGEPGYVAWGALDANPYSPMQVELAHVDSQSRFNESYKRYIWLIRKYATKYDVPLTLDGSGKGVKTHQWVTVNYGGDHVDPYGYLAKWGISKSQLAHDIKYGLSGSESTTAKPSKPKKAEYFSWTPYMIYAKKQVSAYAKASQVGSGKNVKKIYKENATMKVAKLEGKRFKLTDGTYVTANKDYVNNLYYLPKSKIKQVRSVAAKGSGRYDDIKFNHKNAHFPKGMYFDIVKVVPYGKASRFLLANGNYISANKLVNKMVK